MLKILMFSFEFGILCGCRSITPYITKYGKHPVTGTPLKLDDLIPVTFHKNAEGLDFFFFNFFTSSMEFCIEQLLIENFKFNCEWFMIKMTVQNIRT